MAFLPFRGVLNTLWQPKTASVAIAIGDALESTSGGLNPAADTTVSVIGVSQREVTSASSDYASTTAIPYWVATDTTEFIADVDGTATTAMVGLYRDLAADGQAVNVSGTSHNQLLITQFISASKVVVKFAGAAQFKNAA